MDSLDLLVQALQELSADMKDLNAALVAGMEDEE